MVNHQQLTISPVAMVHPNEYFRPLLIIIAMYNVQCTESYSVSSQ